MHAVSPAKKLSYEEKLKLKKASYFIPNKVAKPQTQQFLTNSPDSDEHPIWSPNGKYIAFQRGNFKLKKVYNVWVMDADGSNQRKITDCVYDCQQPAWSRDGKKIVYRKALGELEAEGNRAFDIYQMDLISKKEEALIVREASIEKHPVYSYDAQFVLFTSDDNIYTLNVDSLEARPKSITNKSTTKYAHPSFSRNGKLILFHAYMLEEETTANDSSAVIYPTRIGIASTSGDGKQQWINTSDSLALPKHAFYTKNPKIITFHAKDSIRKGRRNVYAIDIRLSKPIQITAVKNAKHPQLSPNGNYLVYAHNRRLKMGFKRQYDISVVKINYRRLLKLTK
jgi:Tol biopolymer transport system component